MELTKTKLLKMCVILKYRFDELSPQTFWQYFVFEMKFIVFLYFVFRQLSAIKSAHIKNIYFKITIDLKLRICFSYVRLLLIMLVTLSWRQMFHC